MNESDAPFIAHAREDVPALIARVRELEAQMEDAAAFGHLSDLAAGVEAERQRCLDAVAEIRAMYPETVFLPESVSLDGHSARVARQTCDNIKAAILAAE